MPGRMLQHQLVCDSSQDDAGDDRHVQIGVSEPRQPTGLSSLRYPLGAGLGALVEVDPPHRDAADQRRDEGQNILRGPVQLGEGRAVDDDGLAERDDDEAGAALGHVAALDRPGLDRREAQLGDPEANRGRDVFDRQRHDPEPQPRLPMGQTAQDPEDRGAAEPDQDADRIVPHRGAMARGCEQPEGGASNLHGRIGDGEPEASALKGGRDRRRQHQAAQHHQEDQDADGRQLGVEPVGDPGGVDPHPPHREKQQRDLDRAERREVLQQRMRDLRDREDEDEVEEQLRVGHAARLVRHDHAKHRAARIIRSHPRPPPRDQIRYRSGQVPGTPGPGTPVCSASACSTPPIWPRND